jgi:hypothetical protein
VLAFLLLLIRLGGIGWPQVSADLQLELADLLSLRYEYHDLGMLKMGWPPVPAAHGMPQAT